MQHAIKVDASKLTTALRVAERCTHDGESRMNRTGIHVTSESIAWIWGTNRYSIAVTGPIPVVAVEPIETFAIGVRARDARILLALLQSTNSDTVLITITDETITVRAGSSSLTTPTTEAPPWPRQLKNLKDSSHTSARRIAALDYNYVNAIVSLLCETRDPIKDTDLNIAVQEPDDPIVLQSALTTILLMPRLGSDADRCAVVDRLSRTLDLAPIDD